MPRSLALALALPLLLAACGPSRSTGLLGGPGAVALIAEPGRATTLEAYRIDGSFGRPPSDGPKIGEYPILAGPVALDDATRAELASILTDDGTYLWDLAKACEFMPGVALRFADATTRVDVLLCFSCDELQVWKDGEYVDGEDFDDRRPDLARIVRRLFPGDAALQKL